MHCTKHSALLTTTSVLQVVLSHKKMKYSTLTGSFGYDGVNEFLRDLSYGKGRTTPVRGAKMPKVGDWYPGL